MSLTSLYVFDRETKRIHRIGDDPHDALYVRNGAIRYHNMKNGDGGGCENDHSYGYVILQSKDGFLEDEFGIIIDKRFEKEIQVYLEDFSSPIISKDSLGDCNSCGNAGTSTCNSCVNGSRYLKRQERINSTIANNLVCLLKDKNRTQLELAEHLGVTQATVSNWCNGIKMPRIEKIDLICEFFDIKRSDLIG